jgi:hypothetical protein
VSRKRHVLPVVVGPAAPLGGEAAGIGKSGQSPASLHNAAVQEAATTLSSGGGQKGASSSKNARTGIVA